MIVPSSPTQLSLGGPVVLLMARTVLTVMAQSCVAVYYYLAGSPVPWKDATPWWSVYGTAVDLGCVGLLIYFTRKEGVTLPELIGFRRDRWVWDLFQGFGLFLLIFPLLFVGGAIFGSWVVYGSPVPPLYPGELGARILPSWGIIYSTCFWWIGWSITEETVYQAYCLVRLEKIIGHTLPAILLVAFFFTLQHSFFPLIPDMKYVLWRFLAFLPGCLAITLVYARTRRLPLLIAAHWPMDIVAVAMTIQWNAL